MSKNLSRQIAIATLLGDLSAEIGRPAAYCDDDRLRLWRSVVAFQALHNLTEKQLCKRVGLSAKVMLSIEAGNIGNVKRRMVARLLVAALKSPRR